MSQMIKTQVVVVGGGPAGYSAAFRCADLGLEVLLVERHSKLGGVCLNVGCIPSKALLHIAKVINDSKAMAEQGVLFDEPKINLAKIADWKTRVINQLTTGLNSMAKQRQVRVLQGIGRFSGSHQLTVETSKGEETTIQFEQAIIAAGSRPVCLPFIPQEDPRIWDSTSALMLETIPKRLLVMGGGIIGLEMATVYQALGSTIDVVEMAEQLIPAADKDIIQRYSKQAGSRFTIRLSTQVTAVEAQLEAIVVTLKDRSGATEEQRYDAVLVAVGRQPNGLSIAADQAGIRVDEQGFILVDKQQRTNVSHIFAIGDIAGQPMLAHKGVHEGHIAAEVIAGKKHYFDPKAIPSIAYTEPEVAWVGLTEKAAKAQGIAVETATFPWAASGRAIASDCAQGMTKLIFDKQSNRLLGGAIVGSNGGELLGEIALAVEMGCDAADIALTVHAHPTFYESIGLAAELFEGSITDLPNPKANSGKKDPTLSFG